MGGGGTIAVSLRCGGGDKKGIKLAFLRFRECARPPSVVDEALGCTCLQWATAECEETETESDKLERETNRTAAGKRFGVIYFETILSTLNVVWANIAVHLGTAKLPWNRD